MYQHLVLVGVLISLGIVPYVMRRVPKSSDKSLSQHIAKDTRTIRFAQTVFSLVAVLVVLWYFGWYVEAHDTFLLQGVLLVAVCLLAAFAGLVPYHRGRRAGDIHNFVAWSYAAALPFLVLSFVWTSGTTAAKIIVSLCAAWQCYSVIQYWLKPSTKRYFLQYQLSYIAAFAVTLLAATYLG